MKKVILCMILVMGFLSFSNVSNNGRVDFFNDLISNDNRSFSSYRNRGVDRHDFDELKLKAEAGYNKKELKRKRRVMLNNIFAN